MFFREKKILVKNFFINKKKYFKNLLPMNFYLEV